jgi:D-alanyl-D-alanine carboxypeptidase (penicillin-binding protein 5/6)
VLDAHPLAGDERGPTITYDAVDVALQDAAFAENAPIAPVRTGATTTQRDLIEYALVDSAANAATSLARWAFGDQDAYVAAANAWLQREGLLGTTVADAAGLDARTVSTAADLVAIGERIVADPVTLSAIQMPSVSIPGIGTAPNTNRILGQHDIDGGKTGTLVVWGRNLFVTAERVIDGVPRRVVVVIMGTIQATVTDEAAIALLETVFANVQQRELLPAGALVGTYEAPWGSSVEATTTETIVGTTWGATVPEVDVELASLPTEGHRTEVGTVTSPSASETVTVLVEPSGRIAAPDLWWRLTHPLDVLGWLTDP